MSPVLQSDSMGRWIDAPSKRVNAAGVKCAYRRLGPSTGEAPLTVSAGESLQADHGADVPQAARGDRSVG